MHKIDSQSHINIICQMMDESKRTENQEISEEKQLQDQLEKINLDYQLLVNKSREMAPKGTNSTKSDPNADNNVNDDDLEGWCLS